MKNKSFLKCAMNHDLRLGYLVFETRHLALWDTFCQEILGLQTPHSNGSGGNGWQVDEATQRLITVEGPSDDLRALGIECVDDAAMDRTVTRLKLNGVDVIESTPLLRQERRVKRLVVCADPAGNTIELFTGPEQASRPFASASFPTGFSTGSAGLGHAVLIARNVAAMEAFYVGALGFAVTERLATRVGPINFRGVFLHCNERHHSLALFDLPLKKRIHHFMLQAAKISDVGRAYERAGRAKVPVSLGLGQHPDPDGTFSFYGATPSGFDFEIGADAREIQTEGWQVQNTKTTSSWGHKPTLRLQLKVGWGLISEKMGFNRLGR
jgi:2,3-dihydroxybiphenyl 1,2-dioxygenase